MMHKQLKPIFSLKQDVEIYNLIVGEKQQWITAAYDQHKHGYSPLASHAKIAEFVTNAIPRAVIENSHIVRIDPSGELGEYSNSNKNTVILIPIGDVDGEIVFYYNDQQVVDNYKTPILTRLNVPFNIKNNDRRQCIYSIFVEIPGPYWLNYLRYN